jgi:hypothetical protein
MLKIEELKKLRWIFIPVVSAIIIEQFFWHINPGIWNNNIASPEFTYKSNFLLHLSQMIVLWVVFSWDIIMQKKWKPTLLILFAAAILSFVPIQKISTNISVNLLLELIVNPYGILLVIRSLLTNQKNNIALKYLLGLSFFMLSSYAHSFLYNILELINTKNHLFKLYLETITNKTIFYSFLYYYIFFIEKYSIKDLAKMPILCFKEDISRKDFIWNFILNYTFFAYQYYAIHKFFSYTVFPDISLGQVANSIFLLIMLFTLVIIGYNLISISRVWLNKNQRTQSWNLMLLFIPLINIITLFIITNKRLNTWHMAKLHGEKSIKERENRLNDSCKIFILVVQLLGTLNFFIKKYEVLMNTNKVWMILITLLAASNFLFFILFTKNKRAVYLLIVNAILFFGANLIGGSLYLNTHLPSLIFTLLGYLLLIFIFHPNSNYIKQTEIK